MSILPAAFAVPEVPITSSTAPAVCAGKSWLQDLTANAQSNSEKTELFIADR
jgi:hypothetical protein